MSELVEGIKLLGGIAGLGTAAFTLYDRLVRNRPLLSLTAAAHLYDDHGVPYLRLANRSDRELVVTFIETTKVATVHLHDDTRSIIEHELGNRHARLIAPGETAFFEIYLDEEFRESMLSSSAVISFCVIWHWAAGFTWLGGLPLTVSVRSDDLALVLTDAARRNVPAPNQVASPRMLSV